MYTARLKPDPYIVPFYIHETWADLCTAANGIVTGVVYGASIKNTNGCVEVTTPCLSALGRRPMLDAQWWSRNGGCTHGFKWH